MEDNIFDIDDLDRKIYRIFGIDRFKELMETKELVLVNPKKWDDPFENFFLKANAIEPNGKIVSLEGIADSWYGQCWTYNEESDALWRIYSPNKDGIRVSTTIRKLFACLWDESDSFRSLMYFIGKVSYKDRSEIEDFMAKTSFLDAAFGGQSYKFARLLCIKRTEFSHENEVRILINDIKKNGKDGCYRVFFNYQDILEDVCIDPRLNTANYSALKDELKNRGCTLQITQSELYKVSFKPIRLQ
jgi:hypothetical protein